jgi:V8-like Glu-specific endopeptidase
MRRPSLRVLPSSEVATAIKKENDKMNRNLVLCLVVAELALLASPALAQSSAPSHGSGEVSRSAPVILPNAVPEPEPMPFVDEVDRSLLEFDPEAALAALATVTYTAAGEQTITPPSEQMRTLFLEQQGSVGPMSMSEGGPAPTIIPIVDDREQITDSTELPARAVGWIWVLDANGGWSTCTGALIGPRTVLTAAHCVYDHDAGGWATEARFYPGIVGPDESPPHGEYVWESASVLQGFIDNYDGAGYGSVLDWDLAVITLAEPAGDELGWFALEVDDGSGFDTAVYSYPGDKPEGTLWLSTCTITPDAIADLYLLHTCKTFAGSGGGPLLVQKNGTWVIRAVGVAEDGEVSYAVRLVPAYLDWIRTVIV